jgi:putative hydrolase of the HAD superfamily
VLKAVFFDLDGTLFNRDATVAGIVAWQVREFSSVIPQERAAEFCSMVTTLDDHGQRDKREVFATVGADLGLALSVVEQLVATYLG